MWMIPQDMDLGMHVDGSDMDIVSFDDSEQFEEEDSVCSSWISDNDQVAYWSGWKESSHSTDLDEKELFEEPQVSSLMELSAKCVAMNYAFEVVEQHKPPIPEGLQLRIAFWSFPESKEEIRLYSCLACGSNDKFKQGDQLAMSGHVTEVIQIGFHLSGVVIQSVASHSTFKQKHNVSVTFDRGHITSCKCSCNDGATWCEHAIALCIHRIVKRKDISLRAPVSESLARLGRDQLQKFAQHLISELPQQIRLAQNLLDELLSSRESEINLQDGAPDPTAGASTIDDAKWVLDEVSLRENIKKILARFCGSLPMVVIDVNSSFPTSAPPVSLEWSNFIHSFQGHEPEAMWNLLSIVRHMFARCDRNASLLLNYITEECLLCYQMMFYWLSSYNNLKANNKGKKNENTHGALHQNNDISKHASAHFMEEVVHLWELAVMMPYISMCEKAEHKSRFEVWNSQILDAAKKGQGQGLSSQPQLRMTEEFLGFSPAIRASEVEWNIYYEILGISEALLKEITFKGRRTKLDEFTSFTVDVMYQQISTIVPLDMNEYDLVTKLTHSLSCHGFVTKSCKIASELARRIISGYPERLALGETNFSSITEKADSLCDTLLMCPGNERVVFEVAILGLTVPRLPAASNMDEVKLSYLEMALYQKLTNIIITDEHLAFIRFQARTLLANPYLRGDAVLPLIIVTYIFEVLCKENVQSTVLKLKGSGKRLRMINVNSLTPDDELLGYQCALIALGLVTSTNDFKQPMLCESIRHHRRDLALALLSHCKMEDDKIEEVVQVILDKERHGFMKTKSINQNQRNSGKDDQKKNNRDMSSIQDTKIQAKYGFSFGDTTSQPSGSGKKTGYQTEMKQPPRFTTDTNARGHHHPNQPSRRHDRSVKLSSDSDSGHGEGGDKRHHVARNVSVPPTANRKFQQHRRHQFRQNNNRGNSQREKHSRVERASTWVKHNKTSRSRKSSKSKTSRELTESDSGQEMHFSFEGDAFGTAPQIENWDDEITPPAPSVAEVEFVGSSAGPKSPTSLSKDCDDAGTESWGERDLDSEIGDVATDKRDGVYEVPPEALILDQGTNCGHQSDATIVQAGFETTRIPPLVNETEENNDATSDFGYDDDFNIEPEMFHTAIVEKVPATVVDGSPRFSESEDLLEAAIMQNVIEHAPAPVPLAPCEVSSHRSSVCSDDKAKSSVNDSPLEEQIDGTELTTDFSSPDIDDLPAPAISDVYASVPGPVKESEPLVDKTPLLSVTRRGDENDPTGDLKEENEPSKELLHNVLSAVENMIEVSPTNIASKAKLTPKKKHEKLQLQDLRDALESVCIEQAPSYAAEDNAEVVPEIPFQASATEPAVKKKKPKKNKKKQTRVSINMQSIEAEAYSLFELAKSVQLESRGTNTFSTEMDDVITHNSQNRRLQLAAFEIGLFALNIHNYSSPNWFSRTYSTYVSWIENQAVEVGSSALRCLNERWEGVLTPSESVQIATRASRSGDSVMRRSAADLALSCLAYSQNLSTLDITQSIALCKDQEKDMLERACSSVENAGRHGGIQPELLFHIAKEWHYLHEENQKQSSGTGGEASHRGARNVQSGMGSNSNNRTDAYDPVYMTPEQFVQEQMHQQAQEMLGRQLPRNLGPDQFTWIYPQFYAPLHQLPLPQQAIHSRRIQNIDAYAVPIPHTFSEDLNITEIPIFLQNSYRVGIRALEALTLRVPDETPEVKFALAPPMSDDIRWMCALSAQLGPPYLKIFCKIVLNAVTSPYLLHDLALEAARHFALYNPAQLASHLRSPSVSPLVQKALSMYTELVQFDLILLGTSGYADFVELLRKTRSAFCMAPGGMARFNEILELVRKSYPQKRELWQLIMNGLSKA